MQILIRTLTACLVLAGIVSQTHAQIVRVKGKGQVIYKGVFRPKASDERAALELAKKNALTRHAASFNTSKFKSYEKIEPKLMSQINEVVSDYSVVSESTDKTSKRYSVIIEASINTTFIEREIDKKEGGSRPSPVGKSLERKLMAFVFVGREMGQRVVFNAKQEKVLLEESQSKGSENTSISEDGLSAKSESSKIKAQKTTTGGKSTQKASERSYKLFRIDSATATLNEVFNPANIRPIPAKLLKVNEKPFEEALATGKSTPGEAVSSALEVLSKSGVKIHYLMVGNLDLGLARKNQTTGSPEVSGSVNMTLYDISDGIPIPVASVGDKPFSGRGKDEDDARKAAIRMAGIEGAKRLLDQIRAQGLK